MKHSILRNTGSTISFIQRIIKQGNIIHFIREDVITIQNFKSISRLHINNSSLLPFVSDTMNSLSIYEWMKINLSIFRLLS